MIRTNWKKLFLLVFIFLVFAGATWMVFTPRRGSDLERTAVPGLFVRTSVIDFGLLTQGEKKVASFEFINRGDELITIVKVNSECMCTTGELMNEQIAPGGNAFVSTTLTVPGVYGDGKNATGFQTRLLVQLKTGSEKEYKLPLTMIGKIDSPGRLATIPGIMDFGNIVPGKATTRLIQFRGPASVLDCIPKQVTICNDSKKVDLEYQYLGEENGFTTKDVEFKLMVTSSDKPDIHFDLLITVDGICPHRLMIPVKGTLTPLIETRPKRLFFTSKPGNPSQEVDVQLVSCLDERIIVEKISSELPLKWEIRDTFIRVGLHTTSTGKSLTGSLIIDFKSPHSRVVVPVALVFVE